MCHTVHSPWQINYPWPMGCTAPCSPWPIDKNSAVQSMGHGKSIISEVLYGPWPMGNKLSMTHGLHGCHTVTAWPMGHGDLSSHMVHDPWEKITEGAWVFDWANWRWITKVIKMDPAGPCWVFCFRIHYHKRTPRESECAEREIERSSLAGRLTT